MASAASAALADQDALLNDPTSPVQHAKGDVAVIQFFDYQCIYCAKVAPTVEQFISQNPNVRFIYKEWPIFGSRWATSLDAAKTGLQIYQQKGAEAYLTYHNGIYSTGHNEGKLTAADVAQMVFDAVAQNQFYIFSHPRALGNVQRRMEAIVSVSNPPDPFAERPDIGAGLRKALRTGS